MNLARSAVAFADLAVVVALAACSGSEAPLADTAKQAATGDQAATAAYWQELHRPGLPADVLELMSDADSGAADDAQERVVGLVQEWAAAERSRGDRLANLSVSGVDTELTDYAPRLLNTRSEGVSILESIARAAENAQARFDPGPMAFTFLLSLAAHAEDKDAAFMNTLTQQVSAKATDIPGLQRTKGDITSRAQALEDAVARLRADEVALRGRLTARYGDGFPASGTFPRCLAPAPVGSLPPPPSREEIAASLLGRRISNPAWTFDSIAEFRTFDVTETRVTNDVLRATVATHVKGVRSGTEHDLRLRLTYRVRSGKWSTFSVARID